MFIKNSIALFILLLCFQMSNCVPIKGYENYTVLRIGSAPHYRKDMISRKDICAEKFYDDVELYKATLASVGIAAKNVIHISTMDEPNMELRRSRSWYKYVKHTIKGGHEEEKEVDELINILTPLVNPAVTSPRLGLFDLIITDWSTSKFFTQFFYDSSDGSKSTHYLRRKTIPYQLAGLLKIGGKLIFTEANGGGSILVEERWLEAPEYEGIENGATFKTPDKYSSISGEEFVVNKYETWGDYLSLSDDKHQEGAIYALGHHDSKKQNQLFPKFQPKCVVIRRTK